jgi:hypothetical protein
MVAHGHPVGCLHYLRGVPLFSIWLRDRAIALLCAFFFNSLKYFANLPLGAVSTIRSTQKRGTATVSDGCTLAWDLPPQVKKGGFASAMQS